MIFGPVPSRRLGNSLGVNNIPLKVCSYNCVYCQVGRTTELSIDRKAFFPTEEIIALARKRVEKTRADGISIDYISVVPDGEPTLDIHLGETISALKTLEIPVAVFTNASHLWDDGVRQELAAADLISVKIDAVEEFPWRQVNRPNKNLNLNLILEGIRAFAAEYGSQRLITETMLVRGLNDSEATLETTARFIAGIDPHIAYLGIPTRPTAVQKALPPDEKTLNTAFQIFSKHLPHVECLFGFSPDDFPATERTTIREFLEILTVHPMREQEASAFLSGAGDTAAILNQLQADGIVTKVDHGGQWFFTLKIPTRPLG